MADVCATKKNMSLSRCAKLPNMPRGMITTPDGFKATPVQAIDIAFWQAALLADSGVRIYLWPDFVGFGDNSEAAVYEDTPLAKLSVRDGRYQFGIDFKESLCLHKAMFTHRAISGRVFLFDVDNQLFGTEDVDGNFQGFKIGLLHTEKLKLSNGQVTTKSPIMLVLADNLEVDKSGVLVEAAFVNQLNRLTDVDLVVSNVTANSLDVRVTATCDGTAINGLVLADFVLLENDGTAQTTPPVAISEDDGTYTISKVGGTAWTDGTLDLVAPADLSIEAYESTGSQVVNVP